MSINPKLREKFEELQKKNPDLCYHCFKHEGKENIMKKGLKVGDKIMYICKVCGTVKG